MIITGHFRVSPGLCIKTRSSAQPLIWKWFFILMQIKLIFTRKVVDLASLKVRAYGTRKWPITLDKVWNKSMKWYWRLFIAIFKDFYSGSKKNIHDCTITCSFSPHPWFTTLHNTSSLFKSVAFKRLPMPGHHQCVKIADKPLLCDWYLEEVWKVQCRSECYHHSRWSGMFPISRFQ